MFGDYALLESEAVIFDTEICVQLYFHMWGGGIGKNFRRKLDSTF